jgi:hypothetical protein
LRLLLCRKGPPPSAARPAPRRRALRHPAWPGLQAMAAPIVYALVARASDAAPLASHATLSGNFESVARDCLRHAADGRAAAPADAAGRFSVVCDGHTFNFLAPPGGPVVVCVVVRDATHRQLAFGAAARLADAWVAAASTASPDAQPSSHAFK